MTTAPSGILLRTVPGAAGLFQVPPKRLRERDVTGKRSIGEVVYELSIIQLIVESEGDVEYFTKIPKKARGLAALFREAIPMG